METAQEANWELGSPDREMEAISDAQLASLGKIPRERKAPNARSHGKPGNCGESAKVKGKSRTPKSVEYRRHIGR